MHDGCAALFSVAELLVYLYRLVECTCAPNVIVAYRCTVMMMMMMMMMMTAMITNQCKLDIIK